MRTACLIIIFLIAGNSLPAQEKVYKLLDSTESADINVRRLLNLESYSPGLDMLNTAFKPTKGKYKIYRFLATYEGLSPRDSIEVFHDVILIKVDKSGKILKAFQYTLEWAEPPFEYDLFVSKTKHLVFTNGMEVSSFGFQSPWGSGDAILLSEEGVISW